MNGPEHYVEAERLMSQAHDMEDQADSDLDPIGVQRRVDFIMDRAQVHATLALTAATAYAAVKDYTGDEDGSVSSGWAGVA